MGGLTNGIRIILLILSFTSFVPQYRRILSRGNCVGIIPTYVFFNLIVATEQFALGLYLILNHSGLEDSVVKSPPILGDWLNVAQFVTVWLCHLILFGLYIFHPPSRLSTKVTLIIGYILFLLFSIGWVLFTAYDRRWASAWFAQTHFFLLNPILTVLPFAALLPQVHEARRSHSDHSGGALSVNALAAQAVAFVIVAFCWSLRLRLPWGKGIRFVTWYQMVGWAAVDNLVYAVVQAVLWWVLARQRHHNGSEETAPLLR